MANKQTIFTILLVLVLAALGALWYFYLSGRPGEDTDTAGIDVGTYQRIKDLELDVALFNDPVFRELKQETIPPPVSQSIGRSNPFLPF